jgi:hypothetical protein
MRTSSFQDIMWGAWVSLHAGDDVHPQSWQGADVERDPSFMTREALDFSFSWPMPAHVTELQDEVKPDLPWAEWHFQERVSGYGINPGTAYKKWPWHTVDPDRFLNEAGKFDISYMERIWPPLDMTGIRFGAGNLNDVISLLAEQPLTRAAYLPLFFPEDTGAQGRRSMCSLGYHFMQRRGKLLLWYELRSCDYVRHFQNDVYMAVRMAQHVLSELKPFTAWTPVELGMLRFRAHSFHYHRGDQMHVNRMFGEWHDS